MTQEKTVKLRVRFSFNYTENELRERLLANLLFNAVRSSDNYGLTKEETEETWKQVWNFDTSNLLKFTESVTHARAVMLLWHLTVKLEGFNKAQLQQVPVFRQERIWQDGTPDKYTSTSYFDIELPISEKDNFLAEVVDHPEGDSIEVEELTDLLNPD